MRNVVIVGGGLRGLTSAIYLAQAGTKSLYLKNHQNPEEGKDSGLQWLSLQPRGLCTLLWRKRLQSTKGAKDLPS
jgi:2-polyprenyl-6-methoxyphenol hydroxylase-like FAD-dependent oxidoreductase